MSEELQREINRLSNLKQNKNRDSAWIEKHAQLGLWRKQIDLESRFNNSEDNELMNKLFESYLANYEISSLNDMQNLADLIYEEIMQQRIQKDISKMLSDPDVKYIPEKQIESLHTIQERIWKLKEKIGIINNNKKDDLTALQELEKKFECVSEDSLVLMSDFTTKKIQDINIGDEILGLEHIKNTWKLKKQKVLNKQYNGVKEVIKIKVLDKTLELTPDHLILAEQGKKKLNSPIKYFEASNTWGRNVKIFNYIKNVDDYYKGMLIGWIESDGHKTKPKKGQIQYFISQIVEYRAVDWLLNRLNLKYSKKYLERIAHGISSVEGKILKCYQYHLSTECNSIIKYAYDSLLNNKDIGLGFLAGFMLGDGTINKAGNWIVYQSHKANLHKIEMLEKVLKKYNISYNRNDNRGDFITQFSLGKCRVPILCEESKKYKKWLEQIYNCKPFYDIDKFRLRFIDIEQKKRVWDLTTELGNFIVNGFVIHNCYIPFNRNEFTCACAYCGELLLLRRRVKDFEVLKHPAFSGRFLYNIEIIEDVKKGLITKEQAARYMRTSPSYIDWAIENEHDIISVEGVSQELIDKFVNDNPNLRNSTFYNGEKK